jgi:sortase A
MRTWVDRALQIAERGLVIAAALTFVYWLADGYGRDWLHQLGRVEAAQSSATALTPTPPLPLATAAAALPLVPTAAAPSLPFTRPEDAMPAATGGAPRDSFMAPASVHTAPDLSNPHAQRLIMPSIGADMGVYEIFVVDGEWQVAEYAAGFHNGTALPGMVGNSVFSGHAGLRGAVFKDLYRLQPGDEVIVETATWRYAYRVRGSNSVWPNQIEVMDPTPTPVLTLLTCTNWDTQRLVVVADLVDARPL